MTNRRELLKTGAALGAVTASAGLTAASARSVFGANERVVIGLMGVNGRGTDLAKAFAQSGMADIAYICDVDERAIAKCSDAISKFQMKTPQGVRDFRKVLDDQSVDALVIAAPDHWHAPATIMACAAGKHVYCEKPACHNPREGEWAIEAARKHNRVVQIGTQRRSQPSVVEAIQRLQGGEIGRVLFARGWYNNSRPTIGKGQPAAVPSWLDYSLWQGPAPERPFRDNLIHYNWHWHWNWGTGECGNNGIHSLDVCRWGLGVEYPIRVSSGGGKYRFPDDDQETPDTQTVTYDFGEKSIAWEGRSWSKRGFEDSGFGIEFYGEKGSMVLDGGNYRIYDANNKELATVKGPLNDGPHQKNFLECVKSGARPNAPVEEGVKSTLLCHLGNIAWRTSSTLQCDPKNGRIKDNREAQALWGREYRKGWEPKV